jgi:hypothetical protein
MMPARVPVKAVVRNCGYSASSHPPCNSTVEQGIIARRVAVEELSRATCTRLWADASWRDHGDLTREFDDRENQSSKRPRANSR